MIQARLLFLLLALLGGAAAAQSTPDAPPPGLEPLSACARTVLQIKTQRGNVHQFSVWLADRPSRQEQGLMFVRHLPDHQGMVFIYPRDRTIAMWMKNTLIPLDMLFIRADGSISHIAADATPQSLSIIAGPEPVRAVLELAGGSARELGIAPGDRVFCDALPASLPHPSPTPRRHPREPVAEKPHS
jgi:uncharacterized membrane protein (UPF0127 family)